MQVGEMQHSTCNRGFFAKLFYPVCLEQVFQPILDEGVVVYSEECDRFHYEVFKERIKWLKDMKIKHQIAYEAERHWPNMPIGVTYILRISFSCKADAVVYKLAWS